MYCKGLIVCIGLECEEKGLVDDALFDWEPTALLRYSNYVTDGGGSSNDTVS